MANSVMTAQFCSCAGCVSTFWRRRRSPDVSSRRRVVPQSRGSRGKELNLRNRLLAILPVGGCGLALAVAGADSASKSSENDGPITIEGRPFPSRAAFAAAGLRCGVQEPADAVKLQIERALSMYRGQNANRGGGGDRSPGSVNVNV